ncbi:UTRA domain-containing protein [Bremerella sp. JC770]|uniref:UTRA domain-containing protein n=1 Tax=Bremerella sp. JC770 TaxID=3232137 RepID=UPI0034588E56
MNYGYALLSCKSKAPPMSVKQRLQSAAGEKHLHVVAIHYANSQPFACEDRWINLKAVPRAESANFEEVSANEWLVNNIPFERGAIVFSAQSASSRIAKRLECDEGAALFTIDRKTMREQSVLTVVQISFAPGYQMHAVL